MSQQLYESPIQSMLESSIESLLKSLRGSLPTSGKIPGPGLPLLGDLPTAAKWAIENKDKLPMHRTLQLHEQFGQVYSFDVGSANFVIVSEQKLFKRVLSHEDFQEHVNLPFLKKFGASRGLFMADGQRWRLHRRFSHRVLRDLGLGKASLQESIEDEAQHLVDLVRSECSQPLAPQATVAKAVSNIINRLVFGRRYGFDDPQFESYLQHTRMVTNINLTLVFLPMMLPWLQSVPQLMQRLPGSNTFAQGYAFIKEFCKQQIHDKKLAMQPKLDCNNNVEEEKEQQADFISSFLQHQQQLLEEGSEEARYFADEDLCDIVADFFVAGTDTTAVALAWALLQAAVQQDLQDKLRAELFPLRSCSCLWQQLPRLHYTRAFIDESLRHSVLTPINFRCAVRDTQVGKHSVPAGTIVGANAFALSRDPEVFPEPERFLPERFLDSNGCYQRSSSLEGIAFGGGKRGCMGESLARMELLTFLSRLLQNFQVELPAEERPRLQQILIGEDGVVHQPAKHRLLFSPLPCGN